MQFKIIFLTFIVVLHLDSYSQTAIYYQLNCKKSISEENIDFCVLYNKSNYYYFSNYRQKRYIGDFKKLDSNITFPPIIIKGLDTFVCYNKGVNFYFERSPKTRNKLEIFYQHNDNDSAWDHIILSSPTSKKHKFAMLNIMANKFCLLNGYAQFKADTIIKLNNNEKLKCWRIQYNANTDYFSSDCSDFTDREFFISQDLLIPVLIKHKLSSKTITKNIPLSKITSNEFNCNLIMVR